VAHLLQVQQAAPGLSKDDLALQAFHTLRVAIQDPKSALGKAVRIRGGRIGNLLIPEFLRSKKIRTVTHLCSQLLRIQFELEGANADPILALSRTASTRQSTRKIGEEERMSVFALPRASQTLEEKNGRGGDSRVATLSRGRRDSATQRYEEGGLAITDTTF
jgi:hypothetical protein